MEEELDSEARGQRSEARRRRSEGRRREPAPSFQDLIVWQKAHRFVLGDFWEAFPFPPHRDVNVTVRGQAPDSLTEPCGSAHGRRASGDGFP